MKRLGEFSSQKVSLVIQIDAAEFIRKEALERRISPSALMREVLSAWVDNEKLIRKEGLVSEETVRAAGGDPEAW